MIFNSKNLSKTLFIDIETVSEFPTFLDLPERFSPLWMKKAQQLDRSKTAWTIEDYDHIYQNKAAIFAEFGKIVSISCGFLSDGALRVKSIYGDDEVQILQNFTELLTNHYDSPNDYFLAGHNIKEFDIPYMCRRIVKHGALLPKMLDIAGKKPWQTEHLIDTLTLWKFGDYKNYTSLALLTAVLDIPSPKDDIDGSMVGQIYWKENDLERIANYCSKDVVTVAQVLLKYAGMELLTEEQVTFV